MFLKFVVIELDCKSYSAASTSKNYTLWPFFEIFVNINYKRNKNQFSSPHVPYVRYSINQILYFVN